MRTDSFRYRGLTLSDLQDTYRFTHNKIIRSTAKKITMMISSHNIRCSFTSAWTTL